MFETMTVLEIVASLWIGIMVVVSVMAGVIKADEYFYKRKRWREITMQRYETNARMESHRREYMRMCLNPGYGMNNHMPAALCTASRRDVETGVLRHRLGLTPLPNPAPITAESEARNILLGRMAENAQTQLDNMMRDQTAIPAPDLFKAEYQSDDGMKEVPDDREIDET